MTVGGPRLPGTSDPDDGTADAALVAALDAWRREPGPATAAAVHAALAPARVFVPVVAAATGTRETASGHRAESDAEMSLVTLVAGSGATGVPAFTSPAAMAAWRREVRPVAVSGALACRTALDDGHAAVVLDVAAGAFPVEGAALGAVAAGGAPAPAPVALVAPPGGPDVERLVAALAALPLPGTHGAELWLVGLGGRGPGGAPGPGVGVALPAGADRSALQVVARAVAAALPSDGPAVDLVPLDGSARALAQVVGRRLR